jgi:hypothetical protein
VNEARIYVSALTKIVLLHGKKTFWYIVLIRRSIAKLPWDW